MRASCPTQNFFLHVALPWIVFSILYWLAAYFKPFHVDEYFSWVYAERCSFWEIFTLSDTGIGHPPLFHLLQKIVQTCFPIYHPLQVRLINYIAGSAFILLLSKVFKREHGVSGFFLGIASSACVLNIFVFSRMWGLVCLTSLLLLWSGENYVRERTRRNVIVFFAIAVFGFLSDYSFVLLVPYMTIVIFSNSRHLERIKRFGFWLSVSVCLLSASTLGFSKDWSYPFYFLGASLSKLPFEMTNLLFNFWFTETFISNLVVFAFVYYLCWYKSCRQDGRHWSNREDVLAVGILLVVMEILLQYSFLRVRYASPIAITLILLFYCRTQRLKMFFLGDAKNRLLLALVSGALMLLALSPLSSRNLEEGRFLIVLLPFLLVLIYTTFQRTVLLAVSVLLALSGLLYVTSTGIADYFPPKAPEGHYTTVYQSAFAYSDRYLRSDRIRGANPYFIDISSFTSFCRVCKMGTDKIPYDELDSLTVVSWTEWKPAAIPSQFVCSKQDPYGLSWTDRFQFKYFKPIYPRHFAAYQCEKGAK